MPAQEAEIAWPFLEQMLRQLGQACEQADHEAIRDQLRTIVPKFTPSSDFDDHLWKMLLGTVSTNLIPPTEPGVAATYSGPEYERMSRRENYTITWLQNTSANA